VSGLKGFLWLSVPEVCHDKINRWLGDMDIFLKDVDYITYRGVKLANPLNSFTAKMGYNRLKDYRDFEVLNEKYKNMLKI